MNYIELINEFWKQNGFKPFKSMDTKMYFYLLHQCNIRGWLNPFQLQTKNLELELEIPRKSIEESKNRLKQRGLIDFSIGSRHKSPFYTIIGIELTDSPDNSNVTHGNTNGNTNGNTQYNKTKTKSNILDVNNNILLTRAREERELERFDLFLDEVLSGKCQIWENSICKKFGLDSVKDYLYSFREHAIANARLPEIDSIRRFQQYFVNSFQYFTKANPKQLLGEYEGTGSDESFLKFCKWIREKCPNVARDLIPVTEEEFKSLVSAYGNRDLFEAIKQINERPDITQKYFSLYRLVIKWIEKNKN